MLEEIKKTFAGRSELPLFFSEAGSRAYGAHNDRSDYDVRGIFLPSKEHYFDYKPHKDHIEVDDGTRDFSFFSLDKAFGLLANSNPSLLEWGRSPIVYFNELPDWEPFRDGILANIEFKALFHHYRSHAKSHYKLMEGGQKFNYKVVFYCIRGLISAAISARQVIPELGVHDLFDQFGRNNELVRVAERCLALKQVYQEKDEVTDEEKSPLMRLLSSSMEAVAGMEPASLGRKQTLVQILTDYSVRVKTMHYG